MTILLIDDKTSNIFALETLLEKPGRTFLSATNGQEGLKTAFNANVDLIILDVQMPQMDGFEVAQVLQSHKRTREIPIIFTSAERTEKTSVLKGFEEGAVDYLPKPLDPELIRAKVAVLLKMQQHKKELEEKNALLERAENQIRKLNGELQKNMLQLIENANAVIFGFDAMTYITDWNQECERITGFEKGEVLGTRIDTILDSAFSVSFSTLLNKIFTHQTANNFEFKLKAKNGHVLTLLLNVTLRMSLEGKVLGCLFVGQDITELSIYRRNLETKVEQRTNQLKEALEKEKQLVDIKNRFISIASHEFKVPLSAIGTAVAALKQSNSTSEHDQRRIDEIEQSMTQMKSLLEDVLTLEKNQAVKMTAVKVPIDLVQFLKGIAEQVRSASNYSHDVVFASSPDQLMIKSDERLLRNVFINLLSNAIKFSPGRKEVHITVLDQDQTATVLVKDFGIGINDEDIKTIFDPFIRGANSNHIKGTGLGLSIVKKACEALKASLSLESKVSEGSTFAVSMDK